MISIQPHFRLLLLSIPEALEVRRLASQVPDGALVGMDRDDRVYATRAAVQDLDNVLLHALDEESIPWQDGHFDVVMDPNGTSPKSEKFLAEVARVTRRGRQ